MWQLILLAFVSLAVGLLGGFVGLALGLIRLPVLLFLGLPLPVVAATNLLVATLSMATAASQHARAQRVDWRVVGTMGVPATAGSLVGGLISGVGPEAVPIMMIAAIIIGQGIYMVVLARRQTEKHGAAAMGMFAQGDLSAARHTAAAGIGLGAGVLGGAVGLVLGSVRLPAMVGILRMDPRVAAGTGMVIGILMGVFGLVGHGIQGQMDLPLLIFMGTSAVIGTYYGTKLAGRAPVATLTLTLGAVLLIVGLSLLLEVFLRWRA